MNKDHIVQFSPTESDINVAFVNDQFDVYFQPQASIKSGRTVGLEALVRWNHSNYGILSPFYFLDVVHQVGRSYDLFKIVLEKALSAVKKLHESGYSLSVSVNVEALVLTECGFIQAVINALSKFAFPPSNLILELTEIRAPKRNCDLLKVMSRLRMKGIQLSIDDFGTGNSSLTRLVEGPFTELKIDMNFVKQMLRSYKHMAAVRSSIELAHSLNIKVVAEGVEVYDQFRQLQMLGCDLIQGFYFSKPLSMLQTQRFVENAITLYDNNMEPESLFS
ncbi:EAL domain-containing protein [Vibrio artabrorum]|uniref:EAL domain-containing protein n=1 Tax=Vibrio artabrorum TaxID=446374 RepID=UPI00354D7C25